MLKKTFTPEQIVPKLRQIEVLIGQGKTVPLACKDAGITAQTFYRWRKRIRGLATGAGQEAEGPAEREHAATAGCGGFNCREANPEGHRPGKLLNPELRLIAVHHAREGLSERHACRLVGQPAEHNAISPRNAMMKIN